MNPPVSEATKAQIPLIQQGALRNCYILSNNGLKNQKNWLGNTSNTSISANGQD